MRIEAKFTSSGAFIRGFISCNEFSFLNPIYFLLDTGFAISAPSIMDLGGFVDYSRLKKREVPIGVGGSLECYLIHKISLFLLPIGLRWLEVKKKIARCAYFHLLLTSYLVNVYFFPPLLGEISWGLNSI